MSFLVNSYRYLSGSVGAATGASSGVATSAAVGASEAASIASAAGGSTSEAVAELPGAAVGSSTGTSAAQAVGASSADATADAAGVATVSGVGHSTNAANASVNGSGSASAVGTGISPADGSSAGVGAASGAGSSVSLSWQVNASATLTINGTGFGSTTIRQRIASAQISNAGGTKVRVTLKAGSTGGFTCDAAYIGHKAASGDDYDFESTPTQLTFSGGSASGTAATGASIVTDEINFTVQSGKDLIISVHFTTSGVVSRATSGATGWQCYRKSASDAATVNATGYTTIDQADCVTKVESYV
ncbi:hypothetical protein U8P68_10945 [Rhizobium ruizarguesonis]|jgi:hypothetical protein|uniref:hypothetical protein n=1 Tax=Rhizobium leguminosarum TaxID=384 RepID=UPI001030AE2E|nr:hypothetical protein [Rhizobium leguminosarum]TBE54480.1 hypothetical protein ELH04_08680 [Rhizobium leguminosarum]WSH59836.1 hypothetical protein U8P68_10945 [Rhizobium ruizarguesonis]